MFYHRSKRVKAKICGIRDRDTALAAAEEGADALGFIFVRESRRCVEPGLVRGIISSLPGGINKVGVFVDTPGSEINRLIEYCGLDTVQIHNIKRKQVLDINEINAPVIIAVQVKDKLNADQLNSINASAILLDTYHPDMAGGTGKSFDWDSAASLQTNLPVILAGGLHAGNVSEAVKKIRPYAVDVSSGVETNGKKDIQKIHEFINQVRGIHYEPAAGH